MGWHKCTGRPRQSNVTLYFWANKAMRKLELRRFRGKQAFACDFENFRISSLNVQAGPMLGSQDSDI